MFKTPQKIYSFFFLFLFSFSSFSQYYPLKNSGKKPAVLSNFYKNSDSIYERYKWKTDISPNSEKNFGWESSYLVKEILYSGKLVFGDPISNSLNEEVGRLKGLTELKSDPIVFLFKSDVPNAFATESGAIFISTALVSFINNFDELVYILCHEISHLEGAHIYENYASSCLIEKRRKSLVKPTDPSQTSSALNAHFQQSREFELEADLNGLKYFDLLGYNQYKAVHALQVLRNTEKKQFYNKLINPYTDAKQKLPGFKKVEYVKPNQLVTKSPFESIIETKYNFKTHPNINERINTLSKEVFFDSTSTFNKQIDFKEFKKIAINETLIQKFLNLKYFDIISIYWSENDPLINSSLLDILYAQSLYSILKLRLQKAKNTNHILTLPSEKRENCIEAETNDKIDTLLNPTLNSQNISYVKYFNKIKIRDLWYLTTESLISLNEPNSCVNTLNQCISLKDSCLMDDLNIGMAYITNLDDYKADTINKLSVYTKSHKNEMTFVLPYGSSSDSHGFQYKMDIDHKEEVVAKTLDSLNKVYGNETKIYAVAETNTLSDLNEYCSLSNFIEYRMNLAFVENLLIEIPGFEQWQNSEINIVGFNFYRHLKRFAPIALFVWYFVVIYYLIPNHKTQVQHLELKLNSYTGEISKFKHKKYRAKRDTDNRIKRILKKGIKKKHND